MRAAWIFAVLPFGLAFVPVAPSSVETHVATLQAAKSLSVKFRTVAAGQPAQEHTLSLSRDLSMRYDSPVLLVISDGKTLTTYDKSKKQYAQTEATKPAILKVLREDAVWAWSAFYDAELGKQVTSAKDGDELNQKGIILRQVKVGRASGAITQMFDAKLGAFRGAAYKREGTEIFVQVSEMTVSDKSLPETLFAWRAPEGAVDAGSIPAGEAKMMFADVKPIFEQYCTRCHGGGRPTRNINMASYDSIMASRTVKPGDSRTSILVNSMRTGAMPKGGSMPTEAIDKIAKWVDDGALN